MDNFESLIKEYHPIIYKICRIYSKNDDFDDLYQEVLINLWKSYKTFEGRSKLSTWLYRVSLNTALTYQRNTKKYTNKVSLEYVPETRSVENETDNNELKVQKLYDAISQFKKIDRSIILLYLEEKTYQEIAELTGLTATNIGVKVNRLKKKLFRILKEMNYEG